MKTSFTAIILLSIPPLIHAARNPPLTSLPSLPVSASSSLAFPSTTTSISPPISTSNYLEAMITPAPSLEDVEDVILNEKWHLTTYYTCRTLAGVEHCGTHEPVLPGGDEIAGADGGLRGRGMVAMGVAVAVGAFAWAI